jgi:hypothetical protein
MAYLKDISRGSSFCSNVLASVALSWLCNLALSAEMLVFEEWQVSYWWPMPSGRPFGTHRIFECEAGRMRLRSRDSSWSIGVLLCLDRKTTLDADINYRLKSSRQIPSRWQVYVSVSCIMAACIRGGVCVESAATLTSGEMIWDSQFRRLFRPAQDCSTPWPWLIERFPEW